MVPRAVSNRASEGVANVVVAHSLDLTGSLHILIV